MAGEFYIELDNEERCTHKSRVELAIFYCSVDSKTESNVKFVFVWLAKFSLRCAVRLQVA